MPLFASFGANAARALGLTSGMPPGAPTIDSTSVTPTTIVVNFTPVVGSYTISYFEYSVNGAAYTGSVGSSETSFTISGLIPSTSYSITMRGVDVAGQTGPASSSASATTAAEVANSAPVVTLTQLDSDVDPLNATKLQWSFAPSTGGTYAVSYYQYRLYRGATELTSGWTTTPMNPDTNFTLTGLLHNAAHTVEVRAVSATSGLAGTAGSATVSTDTEKTYSAPSVTVNSVTTSQATFTRTTPTGGTYAIASYVWRTKNSGGSVVNSGTMTTAQTSLTVSVGVNPDEEFTVEVAAVSVTTGSVGTYGASTSTPRARLNPLTPSVGTLSWQSGMNPNSTTAQLEIPQTTYSTSATLVISGLGTFPGTLSGGNWVWSVDADDGIGFNQNYSMYAFVTNRIGGSSGNSNTRTFATPKKGQPWNSGYIQPSAIYFSTTASCTSEFRYTFGGVPSSEDTVGYIAVTGLYVEGIQQTGSNLNGCSGASQTLANTTHLFWQSDSAHPDFNEGFGFTESNGFSPNWGTGSFSARSLSLTPWGGSNISGKYFAIGTNIGSRTGGCAVGCSITSGTLNAYRMRNFIITGYQTTAGSIG